MSGFGSSALDEPVLVADGRLRCLAVAPMVATMTGHQPEDIIGANLFDFVHPDDLSRATRSLLQYRPGGVPVITTLRLVSADGTSHWMHVMGWALHSTQPLVMLALRPAVEPGEQPDAAEVVGRRATFERLIDHIQQRFIALRPDELREALHWAVEELGAFLGAARGHLVEWDCAARATTMTFEWTNGSLPPALHDAAAIPADRFPASTRHMLTGEVLLIRDVDVMDEDWAVDVANLRAEGIGGLLEWPLLVDGKAAGTVGFDWTGVATVSSCDLDLLRTIVSAFAQVLSRERAATQLKSTLDTLRVIYDDAPVALSLIGADGRYVTANRAFLRLSERTLDELVGVESLTFTHADDRDRVLEWIEAMFRCGFADLPSIDTRLVTGSGGTVWVRCEVNAVRHGSPDMQLVCHVQDISTEKAAEENLRVSEHRFRQLVDTLPDPVIRFALDRRVLFSNQSARLLFGDNGLSPSRVTMSSDVIGLLNDAAVRAVNSGAVQTQEHALVVDRESRFFQTRFVAERGADQGSEQGGSGTPDSVLMVMTDMSERRRAESELAARAVTDALTGLPNRTAFLSMLRAALTAAGEHRYVAVLFIDVDQFKVVNDSLGHAAGDDLLRAVAVRLRRELHTDAEVARLGGDEFIVMLPMVDDDVDAVTTAEELLEALGRPLEVGGRPLVVSASIGVACGTGHDDADELVRRSDAAMYRAKARGRSRVACFDGDLQAEVLGRLELDQQLRQALERDELRVFFQPEVELESGRIIGAEALLRWECGGRIRVAGEFIEQAEQTGLIVPIGTFVLEESVRQAAGWRLLAPDRELVVRVNLSARQFELPDLVERVGAVLDMHGLPASLLCLEITETALMANAESAAETLGRLHALGVGLAIDDFGTGYSSLSYLKRFPVDVLKIDRSFVDGLPRDHDDLAIVSTIIRLAESLEMTVTGEGVESAEQAATLVELGCVRGQGYRYSRAVPPGEFAAMIECAEDLVTATPHPTRSDSVG